MTFRNPDRPTPRAGRSAHQQLSAFYTWALPKLDRLPGNPCRDAGRPALAAPRERFLADDEIREFWRATETLGWPFGPGFQLLLLTAQRRGEVFGAQWAEMDLEKRLWTIPGARAKNGKENAVPLSEAVIAILSALPRFDGADLLFPARRSTDSRCTGMSRAAARLRKAMGDGAHFTLHDLRRTAATGMQRVGIKLEVVEAVLNHVSGSRAGIVGVYQRHAFADEKRHALKAWAAEVERAVASRSAADVVAING